MMRLRLPRYRDVRGFTLVEVMVALVIVALAVPALLFTLNQQVDGAAYIRDRSLAQIVALNRLSEIRLALRSGGQRLQGNLAGSKDMADRTWYWTLQSESTEVPNFSRVELKVKESEDENAPALYTLVAFLSAVNGVPGA